MKILPSALLFVFAFSAFSARAADATPAAPAPASWVSDQYHDGDFKLVDNIHTKTGLISTIYAAPDDFKVVQIAAGDLADDINLVTGHKPEILGDATKLGASLNTSSVVILGTLGKNPVIDKLAADKKIDVSKLTGQWESYIITTVANPLPNVDSALVIVGSDRRGTAYGAFELSQAIGVSPWVWWADVTPDHRDNLFVAAGTRRFGPPSVQYRGIFINDEDWGIRVWASKTFEPEVGNFGPKTYAKIFELLLRLKANTLWPAMHPNTTAFNEIPENKVVADDYGIVMGSSHCEPMLRNNVGEWKAPTNQFNFISNPDGVTKYWEERMQTNGKYENLYTIGIRGIHDDPMMGAKGAAQVVPALEKIFAVQRDLISKYVNPDPTKVPQIFCPYKEVLPYYLDNLQVPPDVTVCFPDDNFGYIRYLPSPEEIAKRPGGFGIYYHISYLGGPHSYVWLNTTPPALIWEEMSKAYDHGIQKFWMLNVGDLKPGEVGIDLFMQMAWDINKWNRETIPNYLTAWATQQFGPAHAKAIADTMSLYYQLGYQRKPEELQWYIKPEPARASDFSYTTFEGQVRYNFYGAISKMADSLDQAMPASKKDAFYELVDYPIAGSALANQRLVASEMGALSLSQGSASASDWAANFANYTTQLEAATTRYNSLDGGKWQGMMPDDVLQGNRSYRDDLLNLPVGVARFQPSTTPGIGVAIEGRATSLQPGETAALPTIDPFASVNWRRFDVFKTGSSSGDWTIQTSDPWINIRPAPFPMMPSMEDIPYLQSFYKPPYNLQLNQPLLFLVDINWNSAPKGADVSGNIVISDGKNTYTVKVPVYNPSELQPKQLAGQFVESNGVISIEAEHFNSKTDKPGAAWQVIPGLGRTGDAVGVFPTTAPSVDIAKAAADAPALEYKIFVLRPGDWTIHYNLIPTQPIKYGMGLRYAVGIDDGTPQLVTIKAGTGGEVTNAAWSQNVLNNTTTVTTTQTLAAGAHTLKIYMIDAGVLIEKITLDNGGLQPSYLGPPETRVVTTEMVTAAAK